MKKKLNKASEQLKQDEEARVKSNCARADQNAAEEERREKESLPPIIPLGRDGKKNVYWSRTYSVVESLTAQEHRERDLLRMASLEDYARWVRPELSPDDHKKMRNVIIQEVAEKLLQETGGEMFDPSRIRARGVWRDDETGGLVYNAGNKCYLSTPSTPTPQRVDNVRGHHVYDKGASLPKPSTEPLSYEEGARLIDFLEARTWAMKGSGSLLAGWAVCSFLAGSMPFRPHIWINAPANTGKTFLRDDLIPLFGGGAIAPDGAESTEAGIRRDLGSSTLPVIWDEMEQEAGDKGKQNNINKVIALARIATKGGVTKKANVAGAGVTSYFICSGFLFFSIASTLEKDADISRFLQLRLKPSTPQGVTKLIATQKEGREMVRHPEFTGKFITRLLIEHPFILENAKSLEDSLREQGIKPRRAEMMGVLLAGAHALRKGGTMSPDDITKACEQVTRYAEQEESMSDAEKALEHFLNYAVPHEGQRRLIRQLVDVVRKGSPQGAEDVNSFEGAQKVLESFALDWHTPASGKHKGNQYLRLYPKVSILKQVYRGTQWEHGKLVPVFTEGASKGETSPLGIIYTNAKRNSSSAIVLLFPEILIYPEEAADDEEDEGG